MEDESYQFDDPNLREWFAFSYRIIYQVEDHVVTIATVIHGRRLLDSNEF